MILAEQKRKENIAEYILFVWQMEDLVRAMYFDADAIGEFVRSFTPDQETFEQELSWFKDLIRRMKSERVEHRGHVSEVHELIFELNYLHNTLLSLTREKNYVKAYTEAEPNIKEYLQRSDGKSVNDIEVCLTALYGMLVLRLKKEPVSDETTDAMGTFSRLMALLAHHYRQMKQGEINFALN